MSLDGAGIERLYRSHGHLVLRRARTLLGNEADAQEALQEVFASLLRTPDAPHQSGSVVGWLYQSTTHFCLNQLRNRRTGARLLEERVAPAMPVRAGSDAESLVEVRSLLAQLELTSRPRSSTTTSTASRTRRSPRSSAARGARSVTCSNARGSRCRLRRRAHDAPHPSPGRPRLASLPLGAGARSPARR